MIFMVYVRRISEKPVPGMRLGRHVRHDPRSLQYLYPAAEISGLRSIRHERQIGVLDQGHVGSCTGNAAEGCVGTAPFLAAIPRDFLVRPTGDPVKDEQQALALYATATTLDNAPGSYPPDDTGSDGLSVAKAALRAGLISGYRHCTSLEAALSALADLPVIAGINWYDSFDRPDADGLLSIAPGAQVRGGHEICLDELDVERQRIGFTNSWGTAWNLDGRGYFGWADFARLLSEEGDVTVFTPVRQSVPQPTMPLDGTLAHDWS
jgi:hypothetical protein